MSRMTERLVTTGEAARTLGVDPSTLSRWASSGRVVPASKTIGGHLRWDVDELRRQVAEITGSA